MKNKNLKVVCGILAGVLVIGGACAIGGAVISNGYKDSVKDSVTLLDVSFKDVSIKADEKAHRIEVQNLPVDATVNYYDYTVNKEQEIDEGIKSNWTLRDYETWTGETTAGTYRFKATVSLNGTSKDYKATLTLAKAE